MSIPPVPSLSNFYVGNIARTITIEWLGLSGDLYMDAQISTNAQFETTIQSVQLGATFGSFTFENLTYGSTYYMRIRTHTPPGILNNTDYISDSVSEFVSYNSPITLTLPTLPFLLPPSLSPLQNSISGYEDVGVYVTALTISTATVKLTKNVTSGRLIFAGLFAPIQFDFAGIIDQTIEIDITSIDFDKLEIIEIVNIDLYIRYDLDKTKLPVSAPPGIPTNVTVVGNSLNNTATISFNAAVGGEFVKDFMVTCFPNDFPNIVVPGHLRSLVFENLSKHISYTFTVTALNLAGLSLPSIPSAPLILHDVPNVPIVKIQPANNGANIWITAPVNNGGSVILGYDVTINPGNITTYIPGVNVSFIQSDLVNGNEYTFSIIAKNAIGNSNSPVVVTVTPSIIPFSVTTIKDLNIIDSTVTVEAFLIKINTVMANVIEGGLIKIKEDLGMEISSSLPNSIKRDANKQIINTIFENKPELTSFKVKSSDLAIFADNVRENLIIIKSVAANSTSLPFVLDGIMDSNTSVYTALENVGEIHKIGFGSKTYTIVKTSLTEYTFTDSTGFSQTCVEEQKLEYDGLFFVFGSLTTSTPTQASNLIAAKDANGVSLSIKATDYTGSAIITSITKTQIQIYNSVGLPISASNARTMITATNYTLSVGNTILNLDSIPGDLITVTINNNIVYTFTYFAPIPVSVNLDVNVDANGEIQILGAAALELTNVIVANTKLPASALYRAATPAVGETPAVPGNSMFEFWEPENNALTPNVNLTGLIYAERSNVTGNYKTLTRSLENGLHDCLKGPFSAIHTVGSTTTIAAPFNDAKYTANAEQYRKANSFGDLALGAITHYIMGHVAATSAITNDKSFVDAMNSSPYVKYIEGDSDNAKKLEYSDEYTAEITPTLLDAMLAKALVKAIATKSYDDVALIARQVIGQDASRAMDQDNNKPLPNVRQPLKFIAGDVIYMNIKLQQPTVTIGTGQKVAPSTLITKFPTNTVITDKTVTNYTVKIILE